MERHFLVLVVAYWFGRSLLECLRIVLAWVGSRPILCFEGSGLSLCPLGPGNCSSCEVHSRNYTADFLLDWRVCLHWDFLSPPRGGSN